MWLFGGTYKNVWCFFVYFLKWLKFEKFMCENCPRFL